MNNTKHRAVLSFSPFSKVLPTSSPLSVLVCSPAWCVCMCVCVFVCVFVCVCLCVCVCVREDHRTLHFAQVCKTEWLKMRKE